MNRSTLWLVLLCACGDVAATTSLPETTEQADVGALVAGAALPRIKAQGPLFIDSSTQKKFVPHGYNYTKTTTIGTCANVHSTFNVGVYSATQADAYLAQAAYDGFNMVRIFIDPGDDYYGVPCRASTGQYGIAGPKTSSGLYRPYLDNVADFVARARAKKVYVIPVFPFIPQNAQYVNLAIANQLPNVENLNAYYLSPGFITAKAAYLRDFITALRGYDNGTLLSTIFAYELENEVFLLGNAKPFSMASGSVLTADGLRYDMAQPAARQQAADANVVNWANQLAATVRAADPLTMVSASVFTYAAVGLSGPNGLAPDARADKWFPARPITLRLYSTLDYTDLHLYPLGSAYQGVTLPAGLAADLQSSEFPSMNKTSRPLFMGEFGAFKSKYPSIIDAALAMGTFRDAAYAQGFAGSLFWTWNNLNQTELWHGAEQGGAINGVLAFPTY